MQNCIHRYITVLLVFALTLSSFPIQGASLITGHVPTADSHFTSQALAGRLTFERFPWKWWPGASWVRQETARIWQGKPQPSATAEEVQGTPVYTDFSKTIADPPPGEKNFRPHEIDLRDRVAKDIRHPFERWKFLISAWVAYKLFMVIRRDFTIPAEVRYGVWLRPFEGYLHERHFHDLVSDWQLNEQFFKGVEAVRKAKGLQENDLLTIIVTAPNLSLLMQAFLDRPDVREKMTQARVRFEMDGLKIDMYKSAYKGIVHRMSERADIGAKVYPKDCFVIGDNDMERYGFGSRLINVQDWDEQKTAERITTQRSGNSPTIALLPSSSDQNTDQLSFWRFFWGGWMDVSLFRTLALSSSMDRFRSHIRRKLPLGSRIVIMSTLALSVVGLGIYGYDETLLYPLVRWPVELFLNHLEIFYALTEGPRRYWPLFILLTLLIPLVEYVALARPLIDKIKKKQISPKDLFLRLRFITSRLNTFYSSLRLLTIAWTAFYSGARLDPEDGKPVVLLLLAILIALHGPSVVFLKKRQQSGSLLIHGFYAYSRNPIYLSQKFSDFLILGFCLYNNGWGFAAAFSAVWMANARLIRWEEGGLLLSYGSAYATYTARTPRWLGLPRRGA